MIDDSWLRCVYGIFASLDAAYSEFTSLVASSLDAVCAATLLRCRWCIG